MKYVSDILEAVRQEPSTNAKLEILRAHSNNTTLKEVCYLTYNKHIQFYIKKIPEYRKNRTSANVGLEQALKALVAKLTTRQFTGHKAVDYLQEVLESVHPEDALVIERVISRDLAAKVSAKSINKVWVDLIPMFDPMSCDKFEAGMITFPAMIQEKMDGMRVCFLTGQDNKYEFRTRAGLHIDDLGAFQELRNKIHYGNIVLDGEFLVLDDTGDAFLKRKKGNGIINKGLPNNGTISVDETKRIVFVVWDFLTMDEFLAGGTRTTEQRFNKLKEEYGAKLTQVDNVQLVKHKIVNSEAEIMANFDEYTANGGEGLIVKNLSQPWENKRSKGWLKVKVEEEMELEITAAVEGLKGKTLGCLGKFDCKDASGKLTVGVGSGFSDSEREDYWERREEMIGKIITVKYNEIEVNDDGVSLTLQLPIFMEERKDKTEADDAVKILKGSKKK